MPHTTKLNRAYMLWVSMGVLGAHRFYLGKYITGVLQLATGSIIVIAAIYIMLTAAAGKSLSLEFLAGTIIITALNALWVTSDAMWIPGWLEAKDGTAEIAAEEA